MRHALNGRNAGIDLLRGLSILLVVTHHISLRIPFGQTLLGQHLPNFLVRLFSFDGGDAVVMFFVISGFLITRRCAEQFGSLKEIDWRAFYIHRAGRIMPCLLALLAVSSFLAFYGPEVFHFWRPDQSVGGAVASVLTFSFNWYEGRTGWAPANWDVLWSLSIEEAFYFAFPLLCIIGPWPRCLLLLLLVLIGPLDHHLLRHGAEIWQEKAYLPGFGAIATGVLAAMLSWQVRLNAKLAHLLVLIGLTLAAIELFDNGFFWRRLNDWTIWALSFGTAAMLLGFDALGRNRQPTAPHYGLGWLQQGGRLSYEIYLTHMFFVLPAVAIYQHFTNPPIWSGMLVYACVPPLCWYAAALLARVWSRPMARRVDGIIFTHQSTGKIQES
ncbi:acyltransferase family protein [Kozakia baliensis]|uniref:acyltransferase family protein n=1 Tax=Kozakia baliensis TaxID=153496 RepID=UPI000A4A7678|nr:acyltransferase [Kozakia baliensis]